MWSSLSDPWKDGWENHQENNSFLRPYVIYSCQRFGIWIYWVISGLCVKPTVYVCLSTPLSIIWYVWWPRENPDVDWFRVQKVKGQGRMIWICCWPPTWFLLDISRAASNLMHSSHMSSTVVPVPCPCIPSRVLKIVVKWVLLLSSP